MAPRPSSLGAAGRRRQTLDTGRHRARFWERLRAGDWCWSHIRCKAASLQGPWSSCCAMMTGGQAVRSQLPTQKAADHLCSAGAAAPPPYLQMMTGEVSGTPGSWIAFGLTRRLLWSGVCLNAPLNVKLWSLRQVGSPFASHLDRCDEEGGSASQGDASGRQSGAQAGASSKAPSTSQAPGDPTEGNGLCYQLLLIHGLLPLTALHLWPHVFCGSVSRMLTRPALPWPPLSPETAGRKTKSKGVSEIVNHFRDNWVSLGGPVPGPDHSMAVLHSLESLGGDRIVSGDSATTKPCTDEAGMPSMYVFASPSCFVWRSRHFFSTVIPYATKG